MDYEEAFDEIRLKVYMLYRDIIVFGLEMTAEDVLEVFMNLVIRLESNIIVNTEGVEE